MTRTDELRQRGVVDRVTGEVSRESARELVAASVGSDPYEQIEAMRNAGARKARAEGLVYQMEHERKHVIAKLASKYQSQAKGKLSEAKAERLARADERYREHLKGTAAAVEEKELAQSEYWAIRSELEWDRAALAHLNALSRLEEPA